MPKFSLAHHLYPDWHSEDAGKKSLKYSLTDSFFLKLTASLKNTGHRKHDGAFSLFQWNTVDPRILDPFVIEFYKALMKGEALGSHAIA